MSVRELHKKNIYSGSFVKESDMARSNSVRSTLNAKAFSHYAPFSIDKMCASGIDAYAEC